MKLPSVSGRLVTPAKTPDELLQKRNDTQTQKAANAAGKGASRAFSDLYAETSAYFSPETVAYSPLDAGALTRLIAESLRPAYDSAIDRRRESTAAYNANLDADAYARGIGASSYVTDVKQRSYRDEARDVDALEASYGAQLADKLYAALSEQADRKLEIDMFNAKQIDTAKQRAYEAASALYRASGGSKSTAAQTEMPALSIKKQMTGGLNDVALYDEVEEVPAEHAELFWQRLAPGARSKLLDADRADESRLITALEKSLGAARFRQLQQEYPAK